VSSGTMFQDWSHILLCSVPLETSHEKSVELLCIVTHTIWLDPVLVRVSIPAQTSWPRSKLGRKGFIQLTLPHCCLSPKKVRTRGWGFSSMVERLPRKRKALGSVPSSEKKNQKKKKKESQDWNSSRSGSRSWCRGHGGMLLTGLLPLACSACSLIEPKTTSPGMAPPTRGWVLHPWSLIEKMSYILHHVLQLDLREAFPQLRLLFLW